MYIFFKNYKSAFCQLSRVKFIAKKFCSIGPFFPFFLSFFLSLFLSFACVGEGLPLGVNLKG